MSKFYLNNHSPQDLLLKMGFESANRGFVLVRSRKKSVDKPIQIHALVDLDGTIELHEDYLVAEGKHKSRKSSPRLTRMCLILEQLDDGKTPEISQSMKMKYIGLRSIKANPLDI